MTTTDKLSSRDQERAIDRPILFSGPMVRALWNKRKTQTRRLLALPKWASTDPADIEFGASGSPEVICRETGCLASIPMRFTVGDRLWVRETWAVGNIYDGVRPRDINPGGKPGWCGIRYAATDQRLGIHGRAAIHMPRWASRLTLIVTAMQVERLQDISEADARAEGLACLSKDDGRTWKFGIADRDGWPGTDNDGWPWTEWNVDPRVAYARLWDRLHGAGAWDENPWVVATTFEVQRRNVDEPEPESEAEPELWEEVA